MSTHTGQIRPMGRMAVILAAPFCVLCASVVSRVNADTLPIMQTTFTGGEISPLASARIDAQRYYTCVADMTNMVAIPQGPAVRRPGTRFVAPTDSNNVARLLPFRYSIDDVYCLEFTDSTMRVFTDHGLVVNDDDSIYELATPFDANEIADVQVWQSADICYLVDGTDWPQKLVRTDHNDWSISDADIHDGPFLSENATATTISASATTGTGVTLIATSEIFDAGHVGSYWRLRDVVGIQQTKGSLSVVDTNSPELTCQADKYFQWYLSGTMVGTVELQMSIDDGATWTAYTVQQINGSISTGEDTVYDNDTDMDVRLRVACTEYTSGSVAYTLWVHAYMHTGVVKITGYVDANEVTCTVVRDLASTDATPRWSEGTWSDVRGFPRAISAYNDRLVLGSTVSQPLTMWFSATGEYEVFDTGSGDDDDAFGYTLARSEQDPILWITTQRSRGLIAGTTGNVFEIMPFDTTQGITPSNPPTITNTLAMGCAAVAPVLADNILLVVQRTGRKLHEVLYSDEADALVAPDLTLFAEHVTAGRISEITWTAEPYTILWCAMADGGLASLTYDRNYTVAAWSAHTLGGDGFVESVCSIPGTDDDELWLVVRRTIDEQTVRYVEYLSPWDFGDDQTDAFFVDCGVTYDSTAATTFSNLGHLEGESVALLADGAPVDGESVAGGSLTVDTAASTVQIGLPYSSTLTTVRYDVASQELGTTWHRQKSVRRATVSFYKTRGATVGPDASHQIEPDWQTSGGGLLYAGVPELFSGDRELILPTVFSTAGATVTIVQAEPLPLTVRAIVALVEVR